MLESCRNGLCMTTFANFNSSLDYHVSIATSTIRKLWLTHLDSAYLTMQIIFCLRDMVGNLFVAKFQWEVESPSNNFVTEILKILKHTH